MRLHLSLEWRLRPGGRRRAEDLAELLETHAYEHFRTSCDTSLFYSIRQRAGATHRLTDLSEVMRPHAMCAASASLVALREELLDANPPLPPPLQQPLALEGPAPASPLQEVTELEPPCARTLRSVLRW